MQLITSKICTCLLLFCFSGCIGYAPKPLQPTAEIEALFARANTPSKLPVVADTDERVSEWFPLTNEVDVSDGLTLGEANSIALFYSPELIAARAEVKIAKAQILSAGLFKNPELFVGPRFAENGGGTILPAALSVHIPLPGELDAEEEKAEADAEVKQWQLVSKELDVLLTVQRKILMLAVTTVKIDAHRRVKEVSEEVLKWATTLYESAETDSLIYHLARVNHYETTSRLQELEIERDKLSLELQAFIGLVPANNIYFESSPVNGTKWTPLSESFSQSNILQLPQAKAAAAAYKIAEAELKGEVLRQYPSFSFGPEFESDDGDTSLGFGVGIRLPVFDRNRGRIKEAKEKRDAARAAYRAVLLSLLQEKAEIELERSAADRLLTSHRAESLPAAEAAYESLRSRLSSGIANVLEITTAQRAVADAAIREAELDGRLKLAILQYAVLSGEIFVDEIDLKQVEGKHEAQ